MDYWAKDIYSWDIFSAEVYPRSSIAIQRMVRMSWIFGEIQRTVSDVMNFPLDGEGSPRSSSGSSKMVPPSGESRIIFLPERSSICQYGPEISAIIVKTQSRARLVLAHPVLYIVKTQKNVLYKHFENNYVKINKKALWATFGNLNNPRKWVWQWNLS